MVWATRRVRNYAALVVALTVVFTLAYNFGMATWENRPQPLYNSLEVVIQTFTTTGYGEDAPWRTPQMNAMVIAMQLTGIGLVLTAINVFAVPLLRTALTPTPPTAVTDISDHVIVSPYTTRVKAFLTECERRNEDYVIVESSEEKAMELHEAGYRVVHDDPQSVEVLENVGVGTAQAVVADVSDDINANIALSAREANSAVRIVTLVEDETLSPYHRIAGADTVLSPRQLLGKRLAGQVPAAVTTVVDEGVEIGEDFEMVELSVEKGSALYGGTFEEAEIRERFGVNVIGAWFDSNFESPVDEDVALEEGTTLLVAGDPELIENLQEETTSTAEPSSPQDVLIVGYGESGEAVYDALEETDTELTVLDLEGDENVDVVGDARQPDVLREAGIEDASTVILTVGDDTVAVFATLVVRDLNPDANVFVRANEQENVQKLYRAGADNVQSLATISGQMMASTVFDDQELLAYDEQIEVVKLPAGTLTGRRLAEAEIEEETGCIAVAVVRDEETITDLTPESFRFERDDEVVIVGTDESIDRFSERFGD